MKTHLKHKSWNPQDLLPGAKLGFLATWPMSLIMYALWKPLRIGNDPLPPREVMDGITKKVGLHRELNEEQLKTITWINHFLYGSAMGALYLLLSKRFRALQTLLGGTGYGLGVWAGSYTGWLPALGILPPPPKYPLRKTFILITSHLVWGASLAALFEFRSQKLISRSKESRPELAKYSEVNLPIQSKGRFYGTQMEPKR